jgi:hypothetical protein
MIGVNNQRLSDLPPELLVKIFSYLDAPSLMQVQRTCTLFDQVVRGHDQVWQRACYPYQHLKSRTWRDLCEGLHDPALWLSKRMRAIDGFLIAEQRHRESLRREADLPAWSPFALILAFYIVMIDVVANRLSTAYGYRHLALFGYRPLWVSAALIVSPFFTWWWRRQQVREVRAQFVYPEDAELNLLAEVRADDWLASHGVLARYLCLLLDDLIGLDRIGRFYLSEHHHRPHDGHFLRRRGQENAQANAIVEDQQGTFFCFQCWVPQREGEKGSLHEVADARSTVPPPVIRSYCGDCAILHRKSHLLTLAVPNNQLRSLELREVRTELQLELEARALNFRWAAIEQVWGFTGGYANDMREGVENELMAQLNAAKRGDKPVAFTPLLTMSRRVKEKTDAGRRLLTIAIPPSSVFTSCPSSASCPTAEEELNWAEDRAGRFFDVAELTEHARRQNANPADMVTIRDEQETQSGFWGLSQTHQPSLSFRLSDLDINMDEDEADFDSERLQQITLIPAHRATYACWCRRLQALDNDLLDAAMLREGVLDTKTTLQRELTARVGTLWDKTNRQIETMLNLLPATVSPAEKRQLEVRLHDELGQVVRGDQPVTFTPLLGLERALRSTSG